MDLCSLARTSTKLKAISTDIFVRWHKMCDFRVMALDDGVMVNRVLTTFGSSISELCINFTPYELYAGKIMESIVRNCTELNSLTMTTYMIPDNNDEFTKMRILFARLRKLSLDDVLIEGWEKWSCYQEYSSYCRTVTPGGNLMNFFDDCHSLVDLRIVDCFVLEQAILESNFPKLQHMCYMDKSEHMVNGARGFVFRHKNLKALSLGANINIAETIDVISTNCTKLRKLEFGTEAQPEKYVAALQLLGKLEHLTELRIEWYSQNMLGLLKELRQSTSLRYLRLENTRGGMNLIPFIAQIKSLRVLKLYGTNDLRNLKALEHLSPQLVELSIMNQSLREFDFDLVDIVQRLVNLKKLKFCVSVSSIDWGHSYRICRKIYAQLVNIVENRPVVDRYLQLNCPSTKDFAHLLRASVEFKAKKSHFFNSF